MRTNPDSRVWPVPILYILAAIGLGALLPRIHLILPASASFFNANTAVSILSSVTSGMITFTGFVFSMVIVLVQFGSSAYSPRLATYLLQDQVVKHALGMFIATFIYSLMAMMMVTYYNEGIVPDVAVFVAMVNVLASVMLFLALIQRVAGLQVTNVLHWIGQRGRMVIEALYEPVSDPDDSNDDLQETGASSFDLSHLPEVTQTIYYEGRPGTVLSVNFRLLILVARRYGAVIQLNYPPGDMVPSGAALFEVRGASAQIRPWILQRLMEMGHDRTIEQDPKYAIRLIVDIAIRALSPAINDPTTAVQALNELDDLLRRLSQCRLNLDLLYDKRGELRVVYSTASWEDFLALALEEIRIYGASSIQVMRRLLALLEDLQAAVPRAREEAVEYHLERVRSSIERSFPDPEDRSMALQPDRQGIGLSRTFDNLTGKDPHERA